MHSIFNTSKKASVNFITILILHFVIASQLQLLVDVGNKETKLYKKLISFGNVK